MAERGQSFYHLHHQEALAYRGRLGGSHTNLESLCEGATEYHGLLNIPHASPCDVGPDGVGTLGTQSHEGQQAAVYLGRLSGPRFSTDSVGESLDSFTLPPSQTTVPRLNNPQDIPTNTAYRGRLSTCNSGKHLWTQEPHVEAA